MFVLPGHLIRVKVGFDTSDHVHFSVLEEMASRRKIFLAWRQRNSGIDPGMEALHSAGDGRDGGISALTLLCEIIVVATGELLTLLPRHSNFLHSKLFGSV